VRAVELGDLANALAAHLVAPQVASLRPTVRWTCPTPKDRVTLPCGDFGRRIAWWTAELRSGWLVLQDASHRGWKWQGQGKCPLRFRGELVDAACRACGWAKLGVARQQPDWWTAPPELL
jgi:hypothetical protein